MPRVTMGLGILLIVVGVVAYLASGADSPTALLPAGLGVVIAGLGILARREPLRRHALHAALVVALLGLLGTLPQLAELPGLFGGDAERPLAVVASAVTALACAGYVVLGVRSFIAARRTPVNS